jgi:hypothetical protein
MEVLKPIELSRIEELKILQNVRLLNKFDLNPIRSTENLMVQFDVTGDVRGCITCYLCLDEKELSTSDKNYLFPLFVESMNILIGKQISIDEVMGQIPLRLSSPKLSLSAREINTAKRNLTQKYDFEIEETIYPILIEYSLQALN